MRVLIALGLIAQTIYSLPVTVESSLHNDTVQLKDSEGHPCHTHPVNPADNIVEEAGKCNGLDCEVIKIYSQPGHHHERKTLDAVVVISKGGKHIHHPNVHRETKEEIQARINAQEIIGNHPNFMKERPGESQEHKARREALLFAVMTPQEKKEFLQMRPDFLSEPHAVAALTALHNAHVNPDEVLHRNAKPHHAKKSFEEASQRSMSRMSPEERKAHEEASKVLEKDPHALKKKPEETHEQKKKRIELKRALETPLQREARLARQYHRHLHTKNQGLSHHAAELLKQSGVDLNDVLHHGEKPGLPIVIRIAARIDHRKFKYECSMLRGEAIKKYKHLPAGIGSKVMRRRETDLAGNHYSYVCALRKIKIYK